MKDKSETISANYDEEKGTITDENGRERPVHFKLDSETEGKLEDLIEELRTFCRAHCIPFHACVVTENGDDNCSMIRSGYLPGARSPIQFSLAVKLFPKISGCSNPFFLASLNALLKD